MEFELCKSILKMWDYRKSRLYEQIQKVGTIAAIRGITNPTN
ncbi:hypothetical protein LEP1GSC108_1001 [Leptospira weilii str. UI 13098]|uniref:Uncharacterized protein n=1 Tax=Leptospira weilii str. UI 13098 TaxID=1088542 RepID=M6Q975_9LEPT|nr:hypothetical protein LEP1GSC108_1001 [Leptospira weilii str. UI 13098]